MKNKAKFVLCLLTFGLASLVASDPVLLTTLAVGFLAGPHNLMEARYMLGRLPSKAGKIKTYLLISAVGVLGIGITSIALYYHQSPYQMRVWTTLLTLWIGSLLWLRRQENPRRNWPWAEPILLGCAAWIWLEPFSFALFLLLFHPMMALFILGRELHFFQRPERVYLPSLIGALVFGLAVLLVTMAQKQQAPPDSLSGLLQVQGPSLTFLAVHAYLEITHYAIWILILPSLARATRRDRLELFPLLKKAPQRLWAAKGFLALGALISLALWAGFALNYPLTRDIYFQLAIFHVLIEFPFVIRTL